MCMKRSNVGFKIALYTKSPSTIQALKAANFEMD